MTRKSSRQPDTKAGLALLANEANNSRSFPLITAEAIVAIEDEAYNKALDEVKKRFARLVDQHDDDQNLIELSYAQLYDSLYDDDVTPLLADMRRP